MTLTKDRKASARQASWLTSPLTLLAAALVLVALLLSVPLWLPVGPMYWDVMIYYDAANRIFDGQVPINDFFAPVGPIGYYLFAGWLAVFPDAHPTLIAHWSLLAITAPLMALVVWEIDRRSRVTAFGVLIPFLIFALLPFNTHDFYPFPGSDGFGIYNRQCCQLLYVLVAALVFVRDQRVLGFIVAASMLSLFFLKITGFVAALIVCLFGFVAGRLHLRAAILSAVAFFVVLGAAQAWNGIVTHYIDDIVALASKNDETILPRFLQAASINFGVVLTIGLLILVLGWAERRKIARRWAEARSARRIGAFARVLDVDALWLAVVLFAGIAFETQNTGSQAMIFLWPVVLAILLRATSLMATPKLMIATVVLALAAILPIGVNTIERAARTYVGGLKNERMPNGNLKQLGALTMRSDVLRRSNNMIAFYGAHQNEFEDLVRVGELPTPVLYSDFDFQVVHLMAIDRAIASIRKLEAKKDIRFDTIMSLNFVNPLPYLMDRSAPKHIAIGADPSRAVPRPGDSVTKAVEGTDLVLYPTCPLTTANAHLYEIYAPMLSKHLRIHLDECYDAFVHPRFAEKLAATQPDSFASVSAKSLPL
ncbi:MAG: hypothetical protein AB7S80_19720 [Rhizobiaceae bacterium]